ncbi:unnamed protein product [Onchocerca flexuosa]|uniref:Secreted protein n=1 Tax=Onchocerca flexuosa TaxID=387005 RepID=A0A183HDR7_9BILA|nr:unnamed protein product [Onchocerca flexuosa]
MLMGLRGQKQTAEWELHSSMHGMHLSAASLVFVIIIRSVSLGLCRLDDISYCLLLLLQLRYFRESIEYECARRVT